MAAESPEIFGKQAIASRALFALSRLQLTLPCNERYRFTTWRWGKLVVGLVLLGLAVKLVVTA